MTTSRSSLRTLRAIYRDRDDAYQAKDAGYLLYATLLVLLMVGVPVTRTLTIFLSSPQMIAALHAAATEHIVGLVCGAILVLAVAAGSVRGPVLLSPFFVTILTETSAPRSQTLRKTFASASVYIFAALIYLSIVISAVRVFGGEFPLLSGVEFAAACAMFAVIACMLWLVGQALGHHTWILVVSLAIAVAASSFISLALAFTPWGWLGIIWGGDSTATVVALVALTVLALCSLLLLPMVLNTLSREALLQQAQRWQAASVAAVSGDMATALGRFRAVPRTGRRWLAAGRGTWIRFPWLRFLRADFVGSLRTPVRFLGGVAALVAAFTLLNISLSPGLRLGWLLGAIAAGAGYLGCGVLVDGFRHTAVASGAPPLYPYSVAQQYALHLTFPLAVTLATALVGFSVGGRFGGTAHAIVACLLIAALVVLARAFDSAKGPPPLILLSTPISSPVGDPTILFLFAWQADALLIVAAASGVIVALIAVGSVVAAAIVTAVVATGVILLLQRRLSL